MPPRASRSSARSVLSRTASASASASRAAGVLRRAAWPRALRAGSRTHPVVEDAAERFVDIVRGQSAEVFGELFGRMGTKTATLPVRQKGLRAMGSASDAGPDVDLVGFGSVWYWTRPGVASDFLQPLMLQ